MATPLFPTFEQRITDSIDALIATQITPWSFLTAGPPFLVKRFDGREISYQGVTFDGSPQDVFWGGYIEPFLKDIVVRELAAAVESCKTSEVDARTALPELQGLLITACNKVFSRMAEVDRRLRGHGHPESVQLRQVDREVGQMAEYIQSHVEAQLAMWKPRFLKRFFENNPILFFAASYLLGILSGIVVPWLNSHQQRPPIEVKMVPQPTAEPKPNPGQAPTQLIGDPLQLAIDEFKRYDLEHPEVDVSVERIDDPSYMAIWKRKMRMLGTIRDRADALHRKKEVVSFMELMNNISIETSDGPIQFDQPPRTKVAH